VRSVVVTSAVPERRRDWARLFREDGTRVLECSGPLVDCPLLRGESACQLLEDADLALYDLDSVTPAFLPALLRRYASLSVIFARDAFSPGGQHMPSVRRFHFARRDRGACFGGF
jgi:hypothetical protein